MILTLGWFRRLAAAALLLGAAPTGLGPRGPVAVADDGELLVTVMEVRADRAVLWLRAGAGERLRVRLRRDGAAAEATFDAVPAEAWDHTFRMPLGGLVPGARYRYEVTDGHEIVTGAFATAPAPQADAPIRLLWSGDLGGRGHCRHLEDGYRIFRTMADRAADFFLFVGDTMYADHACGGGPRVAGADYVAATLADYRGKHRYNRADPAVQRFLRATPVYATWDDHEVRNNFGPRDPLMPVGLRAFRDYWAIQGPPGDPDRLYRSVRWGRHVEVFILDTRQYRSPNDRRDGPGKTMLGPAQRRWLLDGLLESDATWKLVVSSVPLGMFTGGASSDSWSSANMFGYPRPGRGFAWERDLILTTLRAGTVPNVVFLSGDVHHAELLRHDVDGYVVHEMVAGPLAARAGFPRFLDRSLRTRSLGSLGLTRNFGEILADGEALTAVIRDTAGADRVSVRLPADATRGESP